MRARGVPHQILTDYSKVFTDRFQRPPVEVLLDRICRENGAEHLLTQPRSPTTTGKIERFHRTVRTEFDTTQVLRIVKTAQAALESGSTTTISCGHTNRSATSHRSSGSILAVTHRPQRRSRVSRRRGARTGRRPVGLPQGRRERVADGGF